MTFQNLQITLDELPLAEQLEFEPMAANYPKEVVVQSVITWGIIIALSIVPFFLVTKPQHVKLLLLLLPAGLLLLAVLFTLLAWFSAKAKGVALRDHDIAYHSGLIWRKTIILAFSRLQHIEISSGPLQRKFDLASLKFFTAGGLNVDMKIDGLRREYAEQLRHSILERVALEH